MRPLDAAALSQVVGGSDTTEVGDPGLRYAIDLKYMEPGLKYVLRY